MNNMLNKFDFTCHESLRLQLPILLLLHIIQGDWFGHSLFDLIHPDDTEKLREQLSTSESQTTGRILDLKSKYPLLLNIVLIPVSDIQF